MNKAGDGGGGGGPPPGGPPPTHPAAARIAQPLVMMPRFPGSPQVVRGPVVLISASMRPLVLRASRVCTCALWVLSEHSSTVEEVRLKCVRVCVCVVGSGSGRSPTNPSSKCLGALAELIVNHAGSISRVLT
jgi:hypothetical protein